MTVYILRGPSGSGKSSRTRHPAFSRALILSRDLIRPMLGAKGKTILPANQEAIVTEIETELLREALRRGQDVVVDNTNLNGQHARKYADEAHLMGHTFVEMNVYDPEMDAAYIERSELPADVVEHQLKQAKKMKPIQPRIPAPFTKLVQNKNKTHAYIFDIDGTLARMGDRSPYDYSQVSLDTLIDSVAGISNSLQETHPVLIVSGRSNECALETVMWLGDNDVTYERLYMRHKGDYRPDSVVKSEILDEIAEDYCVAGVFDDRHSVLEMWRTRGIHTFDVGQGVAKW